MKKNPSPIHQRTMMLVVLSQKNYKPVSQRIICSHLKSFSEKGHLEGEEEAARILSLMNNLPEEEVVSKIEEEDRWKKK